MNTFKQTHTEDKRKLKCGMGLSWKEELGPREEQKTWGMRNEQRTGNRKLEQEARDNWRDKGVCVWESRYECVWIQNVCKRRRSTLERNLVWQTATRVTTCAVYFKKNRFKGREGKTGKQGERQQEERSLPVKTGSTCPKPGKWMWEREIPHSLKKGLGSKTGYVAHYSLF